MRASIIIAALGAGLMAGAVSAAGDQVSLKSVRAGTAHETLFSLALNSGVGFAVGAAGQMLMSSDAGASWKEVRPAPTSEALFGVAARGGSVIAVGQNGVVLTLDANGKWNAVKSGTDKRLFAVSINNAKLAVAVGAFGTIIKSTDGGESWSKVEINWGDFSADGNEPHVYGVSVDDSNVITAVAEFGLILRSADAGASWQAAHKGDATSPSLFALDLRADGLGLAVGQSGTVLRSTDHGATWTPVPSGTDAILLSVSAGAGGRAAITGMHEMLVSSNDGAAWTRIGGAEAATTWYQDVTSDRGGGPMLMVGRAGQIVRLDN